MVTQVVTSVPPAIACPTCQAVLTVADDLCYRCERAFDSGELWARYEAQTEAVRAHYR